MPKDPAENINRYKIRGGQVNEYETQQNEGELERQDDDTERQAPGVPAEGLQGAAEPGLPQNVAKRIQLIQEAVRAKVKKQKKQSATPAATRKAAAKKTPAKKTAARKAPAKKAAAKKSAAKTTRKAAKKS